MSSTPGASKPQQHKPISTGMIVTSLVAGVLLLMFGALGAVSGGWWGAGLWIAGFAPVVYGVILLVRRRATRGLVMLGVGLTAGVVGLGQAAFVPTANVAAPEQPAVSSIVTQVSAPVSDAPRTPAPEPTPILSPTSTSPTTITPPPPSKQTPTQTPSADSSTAQGVVAQLTVKGRGPKTGYDRDLFGWNSYDFDRNGCDQRNDILKRDMTDPKIKPGSNGCRVEAGWLQDRYGGEAIYLDRSLVDIDHVVALGNAWEMGAAQWDDQTRLEFANDPLNLVATTQHWNRQKGDSNAASWLPPANRCSYIARQAAVKLKYGLAVTQPERDTFDRILADCPDQPLPSAHAPAPQQKRSTSPEPPKPTTVDPPPEPPKTTAPPKTDQQYRTCKEAISHGLGPYYKGKDPEYEWYRDPDKDGVTCER